ncbi:bifunctional (p)ppGpp synthetase/guanosine-3',5'-bis(diphosphate) 3'-pyrophosphohydrolase [Shewanella avicenniae]|uniref:Bifunctional (P)ppGpp synthetase/guanosine-3',5'-bis(Diphosphate) 3'-pyrophosphohydrolase n=1 Tax=Shewanella avicenniae TaxID=2814294 RepID=A0ABX7QLI5_9GAMM|nr:HD domain-containing protein [Shewanella avicenniae]QSX32244.1 bifunctional (p)ppGpp synthetase/guanosine-3',5'-bis(diphosphate) 3'-pyrophosphohydrolase [Shewanella avicenniae]
MSLWDQDSYQRAWNFASRIHNGQTLPASDISYINHLGLVAMEAMAAVAHGGIEQPNLLVMCALLHDAIEDTPTTYEQILAEFGQEIADGVSALTKDTKLGSKEAQMQDSLARIKLQPKAVWMVKLCDRITNLQAPPAHWDNTKIKAYQAEARLILLQLGDANPFLAQRLAAKIAHYDGYL